MSRAISIPGATTSSSGSRRRRRRDAFSTSLGSSFGSPSDLEFNECAARRRAEAFPRLSTYKCRILSKWIDDSSVTSCYVCHARFTFFKRKHHCRCCGHVICAKCSHYEVIPSVLRGKLPQPPGKPSATCDGPQRMCTECSFVVRQNQSTDSIIQVCMCLCRQDFICMDEWKTLAILSLSWHNAMVYLVSRINQTLKYLHFQPLTDDERALVRCNRKYLIRKCPRVAARVSLPDSLPQDTCLSRSQTMSVADAVEIIVHHQATCHPRLLERACASIRARDWEDVCHFQIPLLEHANQSERTRSLLGRVIRSAPLHDRFEAYWISRRLCPTLASRVLTNDESLRYEVEASHRLLLHIRKLIATDDRGVRRSLHSDWERAKRSKDDFCRVPGIWRLKVVRVNASQIIRKKSKTAPSVVPLVCRGLSGMEVHEIMLKEEDLVKDLMVMTCTRLLQKHSGVDRAHVITYDVVPLDSGSGILSMVRNCKTLYDIAREGYTIQNYLIEHNQEKHVCMLRQMFSRSCAFTTILSYVLGLGDRHLNNILITYEGSLFHIDFGYIMGAEVSHRIIQHKLKLTSEMLDALGGKHSHDYREFEHLCRTVFQAARDNVQSYVLLFQSLVELGHITLSQLKSHVLNRFAPGEERQQASILFDVTLRKHSSGYTNTIENVYDKLYDLKRKWFS